MKLDNIEDLLARFYEGETTVAEEKALKDFFCQTKLLPDNLKHHAAQFSFYARQEEETLDKFLDNDWLFGKIESPAVAASAAKSIFKIKVYWGVAASIALLLTAFWGGSYYRQHFTSSDNTEVAVLRQEVQEMKRILVSATSPAGASASERIRVVSQEFRSGPNQEVIQLLTKTMNTDANVNVRLAACEALFKFKDDPHARQALIQSLPNQRNPLMQITLIDMVVALEEKKAAEYLQKLANKTDILPVVKYKAQEGVNALI